MPSLFQIFFNIDLYEGTNEINRMLLVGILLKRSLKKEIDLFSASKKVFEELYAKSKNEYIIDSNFSSFYNNIKKIKKAILMILLYFVLKLYFQDLDPLFLWYMHMRFGVIIRNTINCDVNPRWIDVNFSKENKRLGLRSALCPSFI